MPRLRVEILAIQLSHKVKCPCAGQCFILGRLAACYTVYFNYMSRGIARVEYCRERRADGDVGQAQMQEFSVNERQRV